jgi:hypothetical protein
LWTSKFRSPLNRSITPWDSISRTELMERAVGGGVEEPKSQRRVRSPMASRPRRVPRRIWAALRAICQRWVKERRIGEGKGVERGMPATGTRRDCRCSGGNKVHAVGEVQREIKEGRDAPNHHDDGSTCLHPASTFSSTTLPTTRSERRRHRRRSRRLLLVSGSCLLEGFDAAPGWARKRFEQLYSVSVASYVHALVE